MNIEDLVKAIRLEFENSIVWEKLNDTDVMRLPFTNFNGDSLEIGISIDKDNNIKVSDLGFVSGLLFELGEHGQDALGHTLTRRLRNSYGFTIDYNEGVLVQSLSLDNEVEKFFDFLKVVTSIQTVLPYIAQPHKKTERRKRLSAQLGKEIKQLKLPLTVQKLAKVEGKHEVWDVDYRYLRNVDKTDILILTADLGSKEPKERVAHIVTLAGDVLDQGLRERKHRELRVVYSANGDRSDATDRAVSIMEDYKARIGYSTFNYANLQSKTEFTKMTLQDLSPLQLQ